MWKSKWKSDSIVKDIIHLNTCIVHDMSMCLFTELELDFEAIHLFKNTSVKCVIAKTDR